MRGYLLGGLTTYSILFLGFLYNKSIRRQLELAAHLGFTVGLGVEGLGGSPPFERKVSEKGAIKECSASTFEASS